MNAWGPLALALMVVTTGCAAPMHAEPSSTPPTANASGVKRVRVQMVEREVCFVLEEKVPDPNGTIGERVRVTHLR